jgi:hypothetical protein
MNSDHEKPFSPSVEALLASERIVEAQPEDVRRRALARARAAVSGAAPVPRARPWWGGWGLRFAVAVVVATAAVSAAAIRARHKRVDGPTATGAPSATPASSALDREPARQDEGSVAAPPAFPSSEAEVRDHTEPAPKNEGAARPAHAASPRPAYERYALELKVLQPARAAVARGDFSSALASIAEHERRFPDGELTEEREALRVQALSGLGRTEEASRAATAFRQRFPGSVLLSRMRVFLPSP